MKPLRCLLQPPVTVCGQAYLLFQGQGGHALDAALNTTYLPLASYPQMCTTSPQREENGVNFTR